LGVVVGLGMMTKCTMAFFLAGIGGGIVLTKPRWLLNRWLWYGATIAFLTFLPNLVWQIRHHFITLDFLKFIHARGPLLLTRPRRTALCGNIVSVWPELVRLSVGRE
jgi:4-amino-4-deoxy-L-arabinose transferase-like glycosyltransferase